MSASRQPRARREGVASEVVTESRIDEDARAGSCDRRRGTRVVARSASFAAAPKQVASSPRGVWARKSCMRTQHPPRSAYRYRLDVRRSSLSGRMSSHPRSPANQRSWRGKPRPRGIRQTRRTTRARERRPPCASGRRRRRRVARSRRSLASLARRAHPSVRDCRAVHPRGRVLAKKRTSAPRRELGLRSARRERARERRRRHAAHRLVQLCRLGGLRAG